MGFLALAVYGNPQLLSQLMLIILPQSSHTNNRFMDSFALQVFFLLMDWLSWNLKSTTQRHFEIVSVSICRVLKCIAVQEQGKFLLDIRKKHFHTFNYHENDEALEQVAQRG